MGVEASYRRISALPTTDTHRKRLHPAGQGGEHAQAHVRHVTEIVPQGIVAKLPPTPPQ